jgi:hypothetical protein
MDVRLKRVERNRSGLDAREAVKEIGLCARKRGTVEIKILELRESERIEKLVDGEMDVFVRTPDLQFKVTEGGGRGTEIIRC